MVINGAHMVGDGIVLRLAGLRHQIRDVDPRGARIGDHVDDFFHQQIGNDARVKRAGSHEDQVRLAKGLENLPNRAARGAAPDAHAMMGFREREIFVSPATMIPFSSSASSVTFCAVEGKIRPRMASTCADT